MEMVLEKEKQDYFIARNILAQKQFADIAIQFLKHKIKFMPLKGIVLLDTLYKNINERFLSDIDILVARKELQNIHYIMIRLGYKPINNTPSGWIPDGWAGVPVDLHDAIWYMSSEEQTHVWSVSPVKIISGIPCRVLPKEEMIIYAIAHSFIHHGHRMGVWQQDVAAMLKSMNDIVDLDLLVKKCRRYNMIVPLQEAFELLKSDLSSETLQTIQVLLKKDNHPIQKRILKKFLTLHHPLKGHILRFVFQRNAYYKVLFLIKSLFPGMYFMKRRYGIRTTAGVIMFYLFRPFTFIVYTLRVFKKALR